MTTRIHLLSKHCKCLLNIRNTLTLNVQLKKQTDTKIIQKNSQRKKMRKYIQCGYSILIISRFNHADNHRDNHFLTIKIKILNIVENIV